MEGNNAGSPESPFSPLGQEELPDATGSPQDCQNQVAPTPALISPEEVARLINETKTFKPSPHLKGQLDTTIFSTLLDIIYRCGLKVYEMMELKIGDVMDQKGQVVDEIARLRVKIDPGVKKTLEDYLTYLRSQQKKKKLPSYYPLFPGGRRGGAYKTTNLKRHLRAVLEGRKINFLDIRDAGIRRYYDDCLKNVPSEKNALQEVRQFARLSEEQIKNIIQGTPTPTGKTFEPRVVDPLEFLKYGSPEFSYGQFRDAHLEIEGLWDDIETSGIAELTPGWGPRIKQLNLLLDRLDLSNWWFQMLPHSFLAQEFAGQYWAYELYSRIRENFGVSRSLPYGAYIARVNEFLERPNFYASWEKKCKEALRSQKAKDLIKQTSSYGHKDFEALSKARQANIRHLNRLLLETMYPSDCPPIEKRPKLTFSKRMEDLYNEVSEIAKKRKRGDYYTMRREDCLMRLNRALLELLFPATCPKTLPRADLTQLSAIAICEKSIKYLDCPKSRKVKIENLRKLFLDALEASEEISAHNEEELKKEFDEGFSEQGYDFDKHGNLQKIRQK